MKKGLIIIMAICFTVISAYSQTTNQSDEKEYLSGLHKPTEDEMMGLQLELTPELDIYKENGDKVNIMDIIPLLESGNYTIDPYVDSENKLKVVVLRASTEEEKLEMEEIKAKMGEPSEHIGTDAKPFNVTDINGNKYSLETLKGKVIVLNFWFVECRPCVMEMPDLNEIVENYKDKDVIFLGFAINDKSAIESFLEKKEFKYNIVPDSRDVINSYGINSFPTHIIIDKNSKITFSVSGLGPTTINDIEKEIKSLL